MTGKHIQLSFSNPHYKWYSGLCDTCDTKFNKNNIKTIQQYIYTFIGYEWLEIISRNSFHFYCHSRHTGKNLMDTAFKSDTSKLTVTPYFHRSIN